MRIFGDLTNKLKKIEESCINLTFKVESMHSPANLWVVSFLGEDLNKGLDQIYSTFMYRKILSVMYVTSEYRDYHFHGKVVTYADGNNGIRECLIQFECEGDANFIFSQFEGHFWENANTYFIDLDELQTNKEFEGLNPVDCFVQLLKENKGSCYDLKFYRYCYPDKIYNDEEHIKIIED